MMLFTRLPWPRSVLMLAAVLVAGFVGLHFWSRERPLATLERAEGSVERDRRAEVGHWQTARRGASFAFGDGVKTGAASAATVALFDASKLTLEPKTTVRFLDRPSRGSRRARLDVLRGGATLEADAAVLDVDLALGVARLDPHTKLHVTRDETGLRLELMIGAARLLGEDEIVELQVGNAIEILPDRTVRQRAAELPAAPPGPASANGPTAPGADSAPSEGAAESSSPSPAEASAKSAALPRGPDRLDFRATPGESFVIHDAAPPTAIGFGTSPCPRGAARLTLVSSHGTTRQTFGEGAVSAALAAGSYRYTFECADPSGDKSGPVMRGTLSVVADAGTRKLPKTAPATSIDADGRRYTVLYQSLLPKIAVTWPNAPEAANYTLTVTSSGGTRTYPSARANYAFASGVLGEGEHTLSFGAGGRKSRPTQLSIRFDNAAPAASLSSPPDRGFAPGESVLVAGAALPGWTVSVAGQPLEQDAQNRFSRAVSAPAGEPGILIRFSHPSRGVHYYLKRSAGR